METSRNRGPRRWLGPAAVAAFLLACAAAGVALVMIINGGYPAA